MKYVIYWNRNTFQTMYHNDSETNGVQIIDNATIYDSEEEAQLIIDENNWTNAYTCAI